MKKHVILILIIATLTNFIQLSFMQIYFLEILCEFEQISFYYW